MGRAQRSRCSPHYHGSGNGCIARQDTVTPLRITFLLALLTATLLWWFPLPNLIRQEVASNSSPMRILWISETNEERSMEGAYIDSTPLYLPTSWNYSFSLPTPVHKNPFPPVASLFEPEFLIRNPQIWEQIEPTAEHHYHKRVSANDLLSRQSFDYSSFWRIHDFPRPQPIQPTDKILLPVQIKSFPDNTILWSDLFPVSKSESFSSNSLQRPLEFRILITAEGLLSPTLIESFTGNPAQDEWLRQHILEHPYWKNARPGYYQVWIGLL